MDPSDPTTKASSNPGSGPGERPGRRRRVVGVALVGFLVLIAMLWFVVIPYPRGLSERNPEVTSLMEQRIDEARRAGESFDVRQEWVPLQAISRNLVRAVIVAEDYRFREHEGIDWVSLAEEVHWSGDDEFSWLSLSDLAALVGAVRYAWSNRDDIRGRSTLTQQLAKNLYFGTNRSLLRKAMEFVVAKRLERKLTKDRILELYLNVVEWGPGVFGAEAAARSYFGRSASSLTLDRAAALAATLPHPLTSNPSRSPGRMLWRKELILDRIDPSRGIPATPMPLPDPRLDLDLGLPAPDLDVVDPDLDVAPVDTASGFTGDSAAPDTLDLPPIDSAVPPVVDTVPLDTVPRDTIGPPGALLRPQRDGRMSDARSDRR